MQSESKTAETKKLHKNKTRKKTKCMNEHLKNVIVTRRLQQMFNVNIMHNKITLYYKVVPMT